MESTLDYRVVTGEVIKEEAASIYEIYESTGLLEWIDESRPHRRSVGRRTCDRP